MAIGTNINLKDKLIKKTAEAGNTSNADKKSITDKADKKKATADTVKMTFYIKKELLDRLYNFAYWDRHTVTEAFNIALTDGLKGKNTKEREGK